MTDKKMADPKASRNQSSRRDANGGLGRLQVTSGAVSTIFVDIKRTPGERIRVGIRDQNGRSFIDIRNWFIADDGEWHPSSKGVTLLPHQVPEIVRGLLLSAQAFDPKGTN
ncbi:transcriptional coactivator p15/PC4 family protein [Paraburkholderia dipogonis]|uniref:Transcriptional coactivator p15/PC4 family protein n=1 Tax=Paraburkholderia dipogonis TaxID=1211383 RepID=A0ABW9ARZ5_9BURK